MKACSSVPARVGSGDRSSRMLQPRHLHFLKVGKFMNHEFCEGNTVIFCSSCVKSVALAT